MSKKAERIGISTMVESKIVRNGCPLSMSEHDICVTKKGKRNESCIYG